MKACLKPLVRTAVLAAGLSLSLLASAQTAQTAICYNCPPEWADWGTQLKAIKAATGITVPPDNKNSGQALAQLVAEKANPVADVVYLGVSFAAQAMKDDVVQAYKPAKFDEVPAGFKDPEGKWVAIHSGTLGFMVNLDALGGKPVPRSWADLLKPDYRGLIGYLDPSSAFVGYVGAVAANLARGGTLDEFGPGLAYFKALQQNQPIVPKQTSYARVLSGEIAIMLDYDFNAYRAKYKDQANVAFVIPAEGTVVVPYVMSLVKGAPHAGPGQKVIDFTLSDEGQSLWAKAYLRPVRNVPMPDAVQKQFLPASEYARAKPVDYAKMSAVQRGFVERYLKDVR